MATSSATTPNDANGEPESEPAVRNFHLLRVLRRRVAELRRNDDLSTIISYMYELKQLFPTCKRRRAHRRLIEAFCSDRHLEHLLEHDSRV